MNSLDLDSLRLLTREYHEMRLREADAERLRREIRATCRRHRLRWTVNLALGASHLLGLRRFES